MNYCLVSSSYCCFFCALYSTTPIKFFVELCAYSLWKKSMEEEVSHFVCFTTFFLLHSAMQCANNQIDEQFLICVCGYVNRCCRCCCCCWFKQTFFLWRGSQIILVEATNKYTHKHRFEIKCNEMKWNERGKEQKFVEWNKQKPSDANKYWNKVCIWIERAQRMQWQKTELIKPSIYTI